MLLDEIGPNQGSELRPDRQRHPVLSLLLILFMVGLGFVIVGPMLGFFFALPFYPGSFMQLVEGIASPIGHPELRLPLYIIQGCATLIGLIAVPLLYMKNNRVSIRSFFRMHSYDWLPVLVIAFTVIVFMAVNSVFIEWNANIHFPESFHTWAREHEDAASELTDFLTEFQSPAELLLALFVIAVLPAIGEEMVFRGLIQNELFRATRNIHVSIWVAAALFSAIHIQFFGFVPRLLLGALFGYLYYWSGNLTLAMIAHFVNNGASVLALYFYQRGDFKFDLEKPEAAPWYLVVISAVLTAGLLFYFHKYFEQRKPSPS